MNLLTDIIRRETTTGGAISFARFMELALYCPQHGYYERKKDTVGQPGDFYTSVSVGPLFGELLAFCFTRWLETLGTDSPQIVEAGAHDGRLAADILGWLKSNRPELFARLDYLIVEPSATRRQWQQETLAEFASKIRWLDSLAGARISGVIFSNELLDAFPVHCYVWDAAGKKWHERGVTMEGEKFAWTRLPDGEFKAPDSALEAVLPDGFIVEACPAAAEWWTQAANSLTTGKLLTIDYGLAAGELFRPERTNGTLRAYYRHHTSSDLLDNVGEQDLTAHVDFSAIQAAGETTGLKTGDFLTQPQFLTRILGEAVKDKFFANLDPKRLRQFQTLTHPEHLGRAFRVLIQVK